MSNKDPAYPVGESWIDAIGTSHSKGALKYGLTKLEWFAGMAIQGTCPGKLVEQSHVDDLAAGAFRMAEAMLAESEKRNATK